jgi:endonuclease/exonuclease/phosphatase family metal-dependent hydrolase
MPKLKVMTLNMNTGHGPKGDFRDRIKREAVFENLERIAQEIKASGAQVVCLQEVDLDWGGTARVNQLEELKRRTGLEFSHHRAHLASPLPKIVRGVRIPRGDIVVNRDCGTAILSAYPLSETDSYDFGQSYKRDPKINYLARLLNECKGFTYGEIEIEGKRVGIFSVHLLNDIVYQILRYLGRTIRGETFARVWQIEKLLEKIREKIDETECPMIVAGDFNSVPRNSKLLDYTYTDSGDPDNYRRDMTMYLIKESGLIRTIPTLFGEGSADEIGALHTYPGHSPDRTLDYIFVSEGLEMEEYRVIKKPVSDHRAVEAQIIIK